MSEVNVMEEMSLGSTGVEMPSEVDLDTLLGLTDILTASMEDGSIEEAVREVVKEPHFSVNLNRIVEALKISSMVSACSKDSAESRKIFMKVDGDKLVIRATDRALIWVERKVELLDTENLMSDFVVFDSGVLSKIVRLCSKEFTLIKREDGMYISTLGGETYIDNIKSDESRFAFPAVDESGMIEVNREEVCNAVKRIFPVANSATSNEQNIVFFKDSSVYAVNNACAAKYVGNNKYSDFGVKRDNVKILYNVACADTGETMKISSDGSVFIGKDFKAKFAKINIKEQKLINIVDRMFSHNNGAVVDIGHISKITDLSLGLDYSLGKMEFNYNEDGKVTCNMKTKRKESVYVVRGTSGDVEPLKSGVCVASGGMRNALSVFSGMTTANVVVSDDGVAFESSGFRSVVVKGSISV